MTVHHTWGVPVIPGSALKGLCALYDPSSHDGRKPFAVDVLTVHQRGYYGQEPGATRDWPNDYESPNPVGFISVAPKTRFLLALSGPDDWTALAMHFLGEAIVDWGIGAKTSAGYGRGTWQTS